MPGMEAGPLAGIPVPEKFRNKIFCLHNIFWAKTLK